MFYVQICFQLLSLPSYPNSKIYPKTTPLQLPFPIEKINVYGLSGKHYIPKWALCYRATHWEQSVSFPRQFLSDQQTAHTLLCYFGFFFFAPVELAYLPLILHWFSPIKSLLNGFMNIYKIFHTGLKELSRAWINKIGYIDCAGLVAPLNCKIGSSP